MENKKEHQFRDLDATYINRDAQYEQRLNKIEEFILKPVAKRK